MIILAKVKCNKHRNSYSKLRGPTRPYLGYTDYNQVFGSKTDHNVAWIESQRRAGKKCYHILLAGREKLVLVCSSGLEAHRLSAEISRNGENLM